MACVNDYGNETDVSQLKQKQLQEACLWDINGHQLQHFIFTPVRSCSSF
jgi:hypothetical protein